MAWMLLPQSHPNLRSSGPTDDWLIAVTGVRAGTVRYYEREGLAETFVTSLTSASASFFHSGSAYVKCAAWLAGVGQV